MEAAVRAATFAPSVARNTASLNASVERYLSGGNPVDKTIVLGFKSRWLDAEIPNALVASYVRQQPNRLVGFAGVDPTDGAAALAELQQARDSLGLRGLTISPAAQDFRPTDSRAMALLGEAARLRMPVVVHPGVHFSVASKMEYARPHLLDEVAREFPTLKMVIAHVGYPWVDECVVLLGKHPNLFADVSGLLQRPWQAYNALLTAHEYGVIDKLFFGSDFPNTSAAASIEALYSINQVVGGTSLPTIPRQLLQGIVERDALALLGLAGPAAPVSARTPARLLDEHDEIEV